MTDKTNPDGPVLATTVAALTKLVEAVRVADRAMGQASLAGREPDGSAHAYVFDYLLPAMNAAGVNVGLNPGTAPEALGQWADDAKLGRYVRHLSLVPGYQAALAAAMVEAAPQWKEPR